MHFIVLLVGCRVRSFLHVHLVILCVFLSYFFFSYHGFSKLATVVAKVRLLLGVIFSIFCNTPIQYGCQASRITKLQYKMRHESRSKQLWRKLRAHTKLLSVFR